MLLRTPDADDAIGPGLAGLHAAGGQLVARMTWLQDDIAARCRAVEANARDDVRRGFVACTPDPAMRERVAALVAGQE